MKPAVLEVVGIYRGRTYVARLTADGMWVVTCRDGPHGTAAATGVTTLRGLRAFFQQPERSSDVGSGHAVS
jgi:hypothetical protein